MGDKIMIAAMAFLTGAALMHLTDIKPSLAWVWQNVSPKDGPHLFCFRSLTPGGIGEVWPMRDDGRCVESDMP